MARGADVLDRAGIVATDDVGLAREYLFEVREESGLFGEYAAEELTQVFGTDAHGVRQPWARPVAAAMSVSSCSSRSAIRAGFGT